MPSSRAERTPEPTAGVRRGNGWWRARGLALAAALSVIVCAAPGADDPPAPLPADAEVATFAGGCFWCVESDFDHVPGVLRTVSGYTGGTTENPTYRQVTAGGTGHYEAVEISFDPARVSYAELLEVFWRSVDPTDDGGQFCDRGSSYRTAIFTHSPEQRRLAEASKDGLVRSGALEGEVVTPIEDAGPFYTAEGYHQDYYRKNPGRYTFYRFSCGRDRRLDELWGDEARRGIVK